MNEFAEAVLSEIKMAREAPASRVKLSSRGNGDGRIGPFSDCF
jgi:hypothetical protein